MNADASNGPSRAPSADADAATAATTAATVAVPQPEAEGEGPSPFKKRRIEEEEAAGAATAAATTTTATAAATATAATTTTAAAAPAAAEPAPSLRESAIAADGDAENKNKDNGSLGPEAAAATATAITTKDDGIDDKKDKSDAGADAKNEAKKEQKEQGRQEQQQDPPLGPYLARESHLLSREESGELSFEYVLNDGSAASSIWLAGLRCVYSRQLPNMPREYVARLVFDRRHASVAIVKRGSVGVLGGITYRRFPDQRLGEIAFCAVAASEQVRGFGTRLMNHAKRFAVTRDDLSYFLTYADNNAVGYFTKQGFTKKITAPRSKWQGFVKDYDGGTLMECRLDRRAAGAYADLPRVLTEQRRAVEEAVRGRSRSHVVWKGLECFSEEERVRRKEGGGGGGGGGSGGGDGATTAATTTATMSDPFDFAPLSDPAASIPGVAEAGWLEARAALERALYPPSSASSSSAEFEAGAATAAAAAAAGTGGGGAVRRGPWLLVGRSWRPAADPQALRAFANSLLCELAAHEDAWPFLEPVDARDVPDYHQVVRDPMDFSTLRRRLAADGELAAADEARWRREVAEAEAEADGIEKEPKPKPRPPRGRFYSTLDAFVADARRIFSNARAYNAADTIYWKLASRLEGELDALLGARISFSGGAGGGGGGGGGKGGGGCDGGAAGSGRVSWRG